jgi:hypothetical protein
MGIPVNIAKSIVRPLVVEGKLSTQGVKRGTKYFPPES